MIPDRIQLNQGGTCHAFWERDGYPWDPGTVTVTVTNDEGVALVTDASATKPDNGLPGERTFLITPVLAGQLDSLTLAWTSETDSSILTTKVDVCGGFLFSVAQARRLSPLGDTTNYPAQHILAARTLAEMALEDVCGVAFAPRYRRDHARIVSFGLLNLPRRRVTSVRAIFTTTDSGLMQLPSLTGLRIQSGGNIFMPSFYNWWSTPIVVTYENGYESPPPRVGQAAALLARRWLVESPWDERMIAFRSREGGEVDILTAQGEAFDIPEVVAVSELYGFPLIGA